jgi:hypothetical protein
VRKVLSRMHAIDTFVTVSKPTMTGVRAHQILNDKKTVDMVKSLINHGSGTVSNGNVRINGSVETG